ncbi:MAG: hypothetical protein GY862_07330 [Gammaproteobacteria bacterium]|nr:hypothetical protein [Gammaproteobacteria bacterium]
MGQLNTEFQRGITAALDPVNAQADQKGHAVTTLHSPWLHSHCQTCGHTFRPGDEVFIFPDGRILHDSGLLPCKGQSSEAAIQSEAAGDFFQGLDAAWPPPKDLPVVRLEQGSRLLAPPYAGFKRHTCAVCGHTFRLHDMVIICPCQPRAPMCQVAIHRDPLHNLHCWSLWGTEEGNRLQYCLATSRKLS